MKLISTSLAAATMLLQSMGRAEASKISGVKIESENAGVFFYDDATIRRVDDGTLQVDAEVLRVNGTLEITGDLDVQGDILINGTSLGETLSMLKNKLAMLAETQSAAAGSCSELYAANYGDIADGVYDIVVEGETVSVYCDMKNGGWTRVVNVLSTTPQADYVDVDAVNEGETDSTSMYKLSDTQINAIAASTGVKDYMYVCADEVGLVTRTTDDGNWTSLRNQGGWIIDRDVDGRYDCTADRPNYIFADYVVDGWSGDPLHDDEDCATGIHSNFGESSTQTGCYMANNGGWAEAASIWVGGQFAKNQAISNCVTDGLGCEYSSHFDKLYDEITR